ncbi:hypothetical protein [Spiroplasma endosymbiont of Virgichneumon dumeticola]
MNSFNFIVSSTSTCGEKSEKQLLNYPGTDMGLNNSKIDLKKKSSCWW